MVKKTKFPVVSVIVPVYNTVSWIRKCIQSIIYQTYKNIEIILVDDGSLDGSGTICKEISEIDSRIKYFWQENKGVVYARKLGVEQATGEYIIFVDSDDWIELDMIDFLVYHIRKSEMITTGVNYEIRKDFIVKYTDKYAEGIYEGQRKRDVWNTMLYDMKSDELQRFTPWICNKLYRTSIVKEIFEDLDTGIRFAEDAVFLYRYLLKCNSFIICHKSFYHYRYRQESASHGINSKILMDLNKVYLELSSDFQKHPMSESLMLQLQKWLMIMTIKAINERMGFKTTVNIPEFILDTSGLKNKRIVLYGAGKMGKDYYSQLIKMGYEIVLWVDGNSSGNQRIKSPNTLLKTEFDTVLIAVSRVEYAEDIIKRLKKMRIDDEKILWSPPIRVG